MTNHLDADALLRAGAIQCEACGAAGLPTDAAALTPALILVTYESPCNHQRPATMLVHTGSISEVDLDLSKYLRGRRCAARCRGRRTRGRLCRAYAQPGSDFCWVHQPSPQLQGRG
jgi:hypothetical protein